MNFNFLKFLEKKSDRPESLVVNPMNRGYDQDAFHKGVAEKVSKDRQEYREKALCFACKNDYGHTDDINKIKLNTQFYEVNTNNGYVSRRKQKKTGDTELTESTAPYFIITDEHIDHYALLPQDVQEHFRKHLKTDSIEHDEVNIDLEHPDRGGKRRRIRKSRQKRRRIRKSRQKRRTTKRRRR